MATTERFTAEGNIEHFRIADIARDSPDFRSIGEEPLVLHTVYSPPEHAAEAAYATKDEADAAEAAGQDEPPTA